MGCHREGPPSREGFALLSIHSPTSPSPLAPDFKSLLWVSPPEGEGGDGHQGGGAQEAGGMSLLGF